MQINRFAAECVVVNNTTQEEIFKGDMGSMWYYLRGISIPKVPSFFQRLDLSILR